MFYCCFVVSGCARGIPAPNEGFKGPCVRIYTTAHGRSGEILTLEWELMKLLPWDAWLQTDKKIKKVADNVPF